MPQVSKHYFRVPLLEEVLISVKPNMITTSENLRHYTPWDRQCYFSDERDLRFFKIYTQRNCELECLSNYTLSKCGCVKFSSPRDRNAPICGATNIECYNQAEDVLLEQFFKDGLDKSRINDGSGCNCLPACTSIAYDAEISQAKFDWVNLIQNCWSLFYFKIIIFICYRSVYFKRFLVQSMNFPGKIFNQRWWSQHDWIDWHWNCCPFSLLAAWRLHVCQFILKSINSSHRNVLSCMV